MFKNTKRVLAIMLAMAVITMSMFTGVVVSATETGTVDLLEFGDYLVEAGSASKYYDTVLADNGETGDSWENAIIIDNAEEFVYLCKASGNDTAGKYYKVADGIKGFNLANKNLDIDGTLADNLEVIMTAGKNHAGGTPGFQGHFDGNGVTVYGAWSNHNQVSNYAGLFTATYGEVTIKNTNVNKAHFTAKNAVGGIIGYHAAADMCTVTIENCSITDSYLETQGTGYGHAVGAMIGFGASAPALRENNTTDYNGDGDMVDTIYINVAYNIKNCYVNLDEANFVSKAEDGVEDSGERACHGGVAGVLGSNALMVSDSVVIGIKPYAVMEGTSANDVQHSGLESHFANVYTTSDVAIIDVNLGGNGALATRNFTGKIFPLSDDELKGAVALENMKLDGSVWMADADGYPELRTMHKDVTFVDNGDGTHGEVCACGFGGVSAAHIWVNNECACGAILDCGGRDTIYWDMEGTVATGIATGSGTKDNPYVITAASEFAWLIKQKADVTAGKYYKIADNIGAIVLQPQELGEEILALKDASEVQAYFENDEYAFTSWPAVGWEGSCFAGIFDGNGATVYGLYQVSTNNAGLFSTVDGGAVIKNIALKNSYLTSSAGNYQVGGIAAVTSSAGYGVKTNGAIWFDSCVVANNYMYNSSDSHDRSGVVIGASSDVVYMDNCLVYDNIATYGAGVNMPVWSSGNNSVIVGTTTAIPEGLVVVDDGAETPRYNNMIRNSVIMGTEPYDSAQQVGSRFNDPKCFANVYSDADASAFLTKITTEQIKTVSVGELATLKLGEGWLNTTTYPELAVFHDDGLAITPNYNGTHGSVCSCGTVFAAPCDFVDGVCSVCAAGLDCASKRTIYWNGTVATGFADASAGTKDDPIIIASAEELAYLISCKADVTADKYFEIANDIGTIVLQPEELAEEIIAIDSAAETQALFENEEYAFNEWPEKGWEVSCFAGNFDGNGVKIYGLYIVSDSNAALFPTIDAGASIHNVAVLNSYIYSLSTSANYQVGAIAGVTSNAAYGAGKTGIVWFDGCIVGNCYMRNNATDPLRSGVIFGTASSDSVAIDNCLVYGNDAKHGGPDHPLSMALYSAAANNITAPASIPEGLNVKTQEDTNTGVQLYYNTVRNTIAFGTDIMNVNVARGYRKNDPGCFENNYTDGAAGEVAFSDGSLWTYEDTQIKAVTLETLNENDLGSAWIKTSGYPELMSAHIANIVDNGDGTHSVSCPCGAVTGEAQAHDMVNGVCTVCGAECAHIAGDPVEENRKEPSCETGNGSYDTVVYCTVCGKEISRETTVIEGGHTPGEAIEENRVDATCSAAGSYDLVVYCTECEEEISRETVTIEKLAHTAGEAVEENRVEATCTTEGSYDEVVYCEVCGEEISRTSKTIAIDENAHAFDDENDIDCNNGCGYVTLVYGDANGDGVINARDCAMVIQHINGWDVADKINLTAADANCDGIINAKDYAMMIQFINGWDVVLGPKA